MSKRTVCETVAGESIQVGSTVVEISLKAKKMEMYVTFVQSLSTQFHVDNVASLILLHSCTV